MNKTWKRFELAVGKQPNEKFRLGNLEIAGGWLDPFQTPQSEEVIMKINHFRSPMLLFRTVISCVAALWLTGEPAAQARTITLSLELTRLQFSALDQYNPGQTYYTVKTLVSSDVAPVTYDEVDSSTNHSAFGGSENGYGYGYYDDIGSALNAATNGAWTLTINKGDVSQKQYTFTVSATGLLLSNSNFPAIQITSPVDGNPAVSTNAAFAWTGAATWSELDLVDHTPNYSFYAADSPSPATTSWNAAPLALGTNLFEVTYKTNAASWLTISTPLDNLSQPFTNWVGGASLVDYAQSGFVTSTNPSTPAGGHTLMAHYTFDNSGYLGQDSSGQGNDINCGSYWGPGHVFTNVAVAGTGAVQFFGGSSMTPCGQAFTSWTNTLAGSFSVSVWINTTNVVGNDGDSLSDYNGQSIIYADNNNLGATPVALTGTKAAFRTTDPAGNDDTLHSRQSVTTGSYVHIVATRDQTSGEKIIYINGVLDNTDFASTNFLTGAEWVSIGGESGSAYYGLVDDVQIYSGVLSASEVAFLYNNPGTNVADAAADNQELNTALGTTNQNWTSSGDASWFVETTNTCTGSSAAAQSGSVINNGSSTLSLTVTGPGTLTFYWSSIANDPNQGFYYEFDVDGNQSDGLNGTFAWRQDGPFAIAAGTHTLSWKVTANGDTDPTQAGFLDQVSYVPAALPVITANPFNQTNYPGYQVALLAAADTNTAITWQWFKVGSAALISGATNALFIPANSGTASVAGDYYAVASSAIGSATTTTAAVSFVSAVLPPDWSAAFKSPLLPMDRYTVTKDYYYGCITDTNGNLYTAAVFNGNMMMTNGITNFDSGTGGDAAAIVKQSSIGTPLWAAAITNNGSGSAQAYCVAPAPGGGVYLSGNYAGPNWLGTQPLADAGNGDIFIARFDAGGTNLWVKTFGGTNADFVVLNTLTADQAGNVTLSGLVGAGPLTIGGSNYNVVGQAGVLIQLDPAGTVRWSQLLPGELPQFLTVNAGRLYVSLDTAASGGATNAVIGGVSNLTDRAWAVACLNGTNGQAIWVRGVGAIYGSAYGNPLYTGLVDDTPRLAVSGTNVFLTGVAYDSTASFGNLTVTFADVRGEYFARYDTNGNAWVATTYGSVTTAPFAAVADAQGNLYVSGDFDTYSAFGGGIIAAPVATRPFGELYFSQAFLAKFDLNGNPLWAREAVASAYGTVNFGGIALASDGVWVSGWCQSGYYPAIVPVVFGTNTVNSDARWLASGAGGSTSILWYPGGVFAKVTDSTTAAIAVTLLNPANQGANFQFQFLSESGFSHSILYRTNLAAGTWQTNSTVVGDGTVKTISLPYSIFSPSQQGFIRVSTQ